MPRSNPKSLVIALCGGLSELDKPIARFIEKGHTVIPYGVELDDCDVIIGPRCWRIDPLLKLGDDSTIEESLERQLEMMEKGVRNIKYPKEPKNVTQKETSHPTS